MEREDRSLAQHSHFISKLRQMEHLFKKEEVQSLFGSIFPEFCKELSGSLLGRLNLDAVETIRKSADPNLCLDNKH